MISERTILEYYKERALNTEEKWYIVHSAKRICRILDLMTSLLLKTPHKGNAESRILDIGPHFLTEQIHRFYPTPTIYTLGFENESICGPGIVKKHIQFDLNNAQYPEKWPNFDQHDLIVMSEVIEHLYTSPVRVLSFLKTLLLPGGLILVTTPNGLSISRRLKLLFGIHPYEMIRESRENPGHIREYTQSELIKVGTDVGLQLVLTSLENYFITDNVLFKIVYNISATIPSFRTGLIVVLRRPE